MSADESYELIEVPVSRKIELKITLDDLLDGLAAHANSIASGTQEDRPQVVERLNRLGQLAHDLRGEVSQVSRLDSSILDRLQRGRSAG